MNFRKLATVVVLGLLIGFASLCNTLVATGALFVNGFLVGMIVAGASERPVRNTIFAVGWGGVTLAVALAMLSLTDLADYYVNWTWPVAPQSAVLVVWVGGSLMMLFWLVLGSLIRVLR